MQAEQQISTAIRSAAAASSATIAEHWLYADGATAASDTAAAVIEIANDAEELALKLSYPEALYAVVSSAARTFGIVGNERQGYEVADMLADNFPNGPILRGFKTLADVVAHVQSTGGSGGGSFTVEMMQAPAPMVQAKLKKVKTEPKAAEVETVAAAAAVAEPVARAPPVRAKKPPAAAGAAKAAAAAMVTTPQ